MAIVHVYAGDTLVLHAYSRRGPRVRDSTWRYWRLTPEQKRHEYSITMFDPSVKVAPTGKVDISRAYLEKLHTDVAVLLAKKALNE